jgi:hypothetical protein
LCGAQVLPEVYGGLAPLVPIEEAVAARLSAQQAARKKHHHTLFGGKGAAAGGGGKAPGSPKSGRLASAGHAVARWSSSAWSLMKKPAQVGMRRDTP